MAEGIISQMAEHLKEYGGMALIIDYGYMGPAVGDSLQAVQKHKYHDVLLNPGQVDLTAHVDFTVLRQAAVKAGATVHGPTTQGAFLTELGINYRAAQLNNVATPKEMDQIDRSLHRLIHPEQMGSLFKVMAICGQQTPKPVGFSQCIQAASSSL